MRHIIAVSGGKDSAALALFMQARVTDVEYVFCDTGRELPELYTFLDRLEQALGCEIVRISDSDRVETNGKDAFSFWLEEFGYYIPTASARWCTKTLKIRPFERYVGKDEATIYLAIRADENRTGNYGERKNIQYEYPFIAAGIDLKGVMTILKEARIGLPDFYKWRTVGGCWCCPFQRTRDWQGLKRHHPDLFQKAKEEEARAGHRWSASGLSLAAIDAQQELPLGPVEERDLDEFEDAMPCLICAK